MIRPKTETTEEQARLEALEEEMVALNIVKLRLTYAIEAIEALGKSDHRHEHIKVNIRRLIGDVMSLKSLVHEKIKELAYER